ncbi:MAG: histidine phosphatase family protein [Actinobacteria bacterium]|nr:histidine phosphatase family protein [Actinomycetota bacterium]
MEPASVDAADLPSGTQIWLIRHGETEWSKSGQHTGRTDIPLTVVGEAEARALRPLAASIRPALVLCSPRRRALDTARLAGLRVDAVDDDLAEWDYGDYEGRTTAEIRAAVPGWTLWAAGCPGGESAAQVSARADRVLARARAALSNGPVVFVAHGHISRVIGARWTSRPASDGRHLMLGTATVSILGAEHGQPALARWNLPNPSSPELIP